VGGITGVSWSWDDQIRVANRERLRIEFGVVEVEDEWDADSAMGIGIAAVLRWIGSRSSTSRKPGTQNACQDTEIAARSRRARLEEKEVTGSSGSLKPNPRAAEG